MSHFSDIVDTVDPPMADTELITSLQALVDSLRVRVKELEIDNAKLSSRLYSCRCIKVEENLDSNGVDGIDGSVEDSVNSEAGIVKVGKKKSRDKLPGCNTKAMQHVGSKRYVALKVIYFGQRFYGFASEAQMDPTVESEIFKALEKTRLIVGDKKELQYSRCGRTDKGVSAVGQVISLYLRSNHSREGSSGYSEESAPEELYEGEIDYVRILNKVLPKDIRVTGWSPASIDFSARFSCLSREYKYFFWRDNLDIVAMEIAGKKFIGEHDFRNFCKMDVASVHNYRRHISLFEVLPCRERQ